MSSGSAWSYQFRFLLALGRALPSQGTELLRLPNQIVGHAGRGEVVISLPASREPVMPCRTNPHVGSPISPRLGRQLPGSLPEALTRPNFRSRSLQMPSALACRFDSTSPEPLGSLLQRCFIFALQ